MKQRELETMVNNVNGKYVAKHINVKKRVYDVFYKLMDFLDRKFFSGIVIDFNEKKQERLPKDYKSKNNDYKLSG